MCDQSNPVSNQGYARGPVDWYLSSFPFYVGVEQRDGQGSSCGPSIEILLASSPNQSIANICDHSNPDSNYNSTGNPVNWLLAIDLCLGNSTAVC
jgi:hypothetical protein